MDLAAQRIINLADPSSAQDAVSKNYVDAAVRGLDWKASVRAASTTNHSVAAPGATVDGITLTSGVDRFLLKNQTTAAENGLYLFNGAAAPATRTTDANTNALVTAGLATTVTEGTVNADRVYILITDDPITVGTTSLTFTQLGGGGAAYTAGNGLSLVGGAFAVVAGSGIIADGTSTRIDPAVVARSFAANVGDGTATSFTVTHNLGTRDLTVSLWATASPWDKQLEDCTLPTVNTAVFAFSTAPAAGAFRAVIRG